MFFYKLRLSIYFYKEAVYLTVSIIIKIDSMNIKIPFFVLGGINQDNIKEVVSAGARRVAVSRAILSRRSSGQAVRDLRKFLP